MLHYRVARVTDWHAFFVAAVMGQSLRNFPSVPQQQQRLFRPGQTVQNVQSPFGARTPGRGRFRTPFTQLSSAPPGQHSEFEQPLADNTQVVRMQGIESAPAESSAPVSDPTLSMAATVSDLERLALSEDIAGPRLRPVVTHAAPSPSDVIRASVTRGRSLEGEDSLSAVIPSLSDQPCCQGLGSSSQPLQVGNMSAVEEARAAAAPGSSFAVSEVLSEQPATSDK